MSDSVQDLVEQVERELLDEIIANMETDAMSLEDAEQLARDFLAVLPAADKEDLLRKLQGVGEKYIAARSVYLKHAAPHEEQKRQELLDTMSTHIKSGNIEEALTIAKGANS